MVLNPSLLIGGNQPISESPNNRRRCIVAFIEDESRVQPKFMSDVHMDISDTQI